MLLGRRSRWFASAIVVTVVASVPAAARATTTATTTTVQVISPTLDQLVYEPGSVSFSGSATDSTGIRSVSFEVQERETLLYLQAGGAWASTPHFMVAALGSPGATQTSWAATLASLPSGDYAVTAKATSVSGSSAKTSVDFGDGPAPTASSPGYLTIVFGRSVWTASSSCHPIPGQPTLLTIAQALSTAQPSTPRTAVAAVVTHWPGATTEQCFQKNLYASWPDLASLRDQYGWAAISASETYPNMTQLTVAQQQTESCGSLTDPTGLYAHGDPRAWGMFAYPANSFNTTVQTGVVDKCFAFGRTYNGGRNVRSEMLADDLQQTNNIHGGTCNAPPCPATVINQAGKLIYYHPPASLANLMNVAGDEWVVIQVYKLVTGSSSGAVAWNCNGAWQTHWTSLGEMYCYDDFMAAVDSIPPNVLTVDPASVAASWNSNPTVTQKPVPLVQGISPASGPFGTAVTVTGSGFTGAAGVAFGANQATSFTVDSDSQITVTCPPGAGSVDVVVTTTKGISATTSSDQYTYA
jgi:IPT/TIG domain/Bacterial Ig domain